MVYLTVKVFDIYNSIHLPNLLKKFYNFTIVTVCINIHFLLFVILSVFVITKTGKTCVYLGEDQRIGPFSSKKSKTTKFIGPRRFGDIMGFFK